MVDLGNGVCLVTADRLMTPTRNSFWVGAFMEFLVVGFGGFFGSLARYAVYLCERSLSTYRFPLGTLFINVLGCLLAGFLLAVIEKALPVHRHLILLGTMGFVGSFTTFSTFGVETFHLVRSGQFALGLVNVTANLVLGLSAIWFGRFLLLKATA
jgi:CrcB protein